MFDIATTVSSDCAFNSLMSVISWVLAVKESRASWNVELLADTDVAVVL
jgi:hypothetical protein